MKKFILPICAVAAFSFASCGGAEAEGVEATKELACQCAEADEAKQKELKCAEAAKSEAGAKKEEGQEKTAWENWTAGCKPADKGGDKGAAQGGAAQGGAAQGGAAQGE